MSSFDGLGGPYPCRCGHDATAHYRDYDDEWGTRYPCSGCAGDECTNFQEDDGEDDGRCPWTYPNRGEYPRRCGAPATHTVAFSNTAKERYCLNHAYYEVIGGAHWGPKEKP